MELFIDNGGYKCIVEDSFSEELKRLINDTSLRIYPRCIVVTITIDSKQEGNKELIRDIEKNIRVVVEALKGTDYTEKMIISTKFKDLTKKKCIKKL